MPPDDQDRLRHILDAALQAQHWLGEKSLEQFTHEIQAAYACHYCFTIIGEAANHLSPEVCESMPDQPWHQIIGMRNRMVHGYYDLNYELIWKTIREDLPPLIRAVSSALEAR